MQSSQNITTDVSVASGIYEAALSQQGCYLGTSINDSVTRIEVVLSMLSRAKYLLVEVLQ